MKHLRQYIRQILTEVAYNRRQAFLSDLEAANFDHHFNLGPTMYADNTLYRKMTATGRQLKKAFADHADREYLNSLKYVHWVNTRRKALAFLAPEIIKDVRIQSLRDELSVMAYLPSDVEGDGYDFGQYGLLVSGYVTLLSNDMNSVNSGTTAGYVESDPQRVASSGANKGVGISMTDDIVLSAEDWNPVFDGGGNEALLDNWKVDGVIVPDEEHKTFSTFLEKIKQQTGKEYLLYKRSELG